jgi:hypothetical protein
MVRRSFLGMPTLAMLQAPLAAVRSWQAARHTQERAQERGDANISIG